MKTIRARVKSIEVLHPLSTWQELEREGAKYQRLSGYTLEGDELFIRQEPPEEEEIRVNELDAPLEVMLTPGKITFQGTFVLKEKYLDGGPLTTPILDDGTFVYGRDKGRTECSFKITLYSGEILLLPHAVGGMLLDINLGKKGVWKYPFKFTLLDVEGQPLRTYQNERHFKDVHKIAGRDTGGGHSGGDEIL